MQTPATIAWLSVLREARGRWCGILTKVDGMDATSNLRRRALGGLQDFNSARSDLRTRTMQIVSDTLLSVREFSRVNDRPDHSQTFPRCLHPGL